MQYRATNCLLWLCCLVLPVLVYTQDCALPVLTDISQPTTDGFLIHWTGLNSDGGIYEIEYGYRGFQRSFLADISQIQTEEYRFSGLEPGTAYEFYIREICVDGDTSLWNGPYFQETAIDGSQSCELSLPIPDDNCPQGKTFLIDVDGFTGSLGDDILFESIALVIDHPWPPDLAISLESPTGIKIDLSTHNGNGIDDYGNPGNGCLNAAVFTDNACLKIQEFTPPLTGFFQPEQPLALFHNGISPNGNWKLNICDRAIGDRGILRAVGLNFSADACILPSPLSIVDIEADNISLAWDNSAACQNLEISYRRKGAPLSESEIDFAECESGHFTISGLMPDTEYELVVVAQCDSDTNSPESCTYNFTTACRNSDFTETFDSYTDCESACHVDCIFPGIWQNAPDNETDWIINRGPTLTAFTGPDGDINDLGAYIYIENQDACPGRLTIDLISGCLTTRDPGTCGLSFWYHMSGDEIGTLETAFTRDGISWETLWSSSGDQGHEWMFASLELPEFHQGQIRFRAIKESGVSRNDIALDHIKLSGVEPADATRFYRDADSDGYGNSDAFIFLCSETAPAGYTTNNDDCDDSNPSVHPLANEIPCNAVDENCNGMMDDITSGDLVLVLLQQADESCRGASDGVVTLSTLNGLPPYHYEWSHGATGSSQTDLAAGIYYVTVSDSNGCQTISDPIVIDTRQVLLYSVMQISSPTCQGVDDGSISLLTAGGTGDIEITWNNGATGPVINGLSTGNYQATITDASLCSLVTDVIQLTGKRKINAGISMRRDVDCFGGNNGLLQVSATGGTPPYSIDWSTGASGFLISGLEAGNYALTVTDQAGCTTSLGQVVVNEPDPLNAGLTDIGHVSCNGGKDGYVDISVQGGTPPYAYQWSSGDFSQDIFNMDAGSYSVTVTDFRACRITIDNIEVLEPVPFQLTTDTITSVDCKASSDGSLEVTVSGATPPYSYNWSVDEGALASTNRLDSLLPGQYFLTVVDALGCKSPSYSFEITNNRKPINISMNLLESLLCFGDSTARISAVSDDVRFPLDFNWSNGVKKVKFTRADTLTHLPEGRYNVTITDNEGCVGISDSLAVEAPAEIGISLSSIENNICSDGMEGSIEVEVTGGTGPFVFKWSDGQTGRTAESLSNGSYRVTVTDANQCSLVSQNFEIDSPGALDVIVDIEHETETGASGTIEVVATGGISPYQYMWSPEVTLLSDSVAIMLTAGDYSITVTDAGGCMLDTIISVDFIDNIFENGSPFEWNIYPVPATGRINIKAPPARVTQVDILDANGTIIQSIPYRAGTEKVMSIDLENFRNGVYILCLSGREFRACRKIVIFNGI